MHRREFLSIFAAAPLVMGQQSRSPNHSRIVYPGKNGKLFYAADELGNTIPDFSDCGYMGGGVRLPDVPVRITITPGDGDAGARIQAAIDKVSALAPDKRGFRGAVLLKKGRYRINEPLRIQTGGVVLRGEGPDENGTVLIATQKKKHALIEIRGKSFGQATGKPRRILDAYAPVGTRRLRLDSTAGLRVGDRVFVRRIGNQAWITELRMDRIPPRESGETVQWKPFDLDFDRVITGISGDLITIDAPLVCAIEARWGGGEVFAIDKSGRIEQVGIENLRGESEFDRRVTARDGRDRKEYFADEEHAWDFIAVNAAENVWVKNITALYFGFSAVNIGRAKWVTVEDSKCLAMVSQITGSRRYCFNIDGQLNLVQRCEAQTGRHDFVVGGRVCGPNVFLYCKSGESFSTSEPHHRWSVGGLYDNVKAPLAIQDRQNYGTGHGWAGANYVAWNTEGTLVCQKPPTAQNWAIGHVGEKQPGAFRPREDGYWESHGRHVAPQSLYLQQLTDRLGRRAIKNIGY